MNPLLEYACIVLGLALGYNIGGYIGSFAILSSLLAGFRMYMQGGQCRSKRRLDGKTVVITGANTGIGKLTVMDLSRRGAKVIMLCRDLSRAEPAASDIRKETKGEVKVEKMDLNSLSSIKSCVERLTKEGTKIDILINNAGIMMCPLYRTEDGFEMQIGTNHFGHFYLTNLLLPLIKKAGSGARIVTVSSLGHRRGDIYWDDINFNKTEYDPVKAYGQSKLANILFTQELAKRLKGTGITTYCLHPGVIGTELNRHIKDSMGSFMAAAMYLLYPFSKTPESGAQTSIFCAVDESVANQSGLYYADCKVAETYPNAKREGDSERLWKISEKLTGLDKN